MPKKIDAARKSLTKALKKHAAVVGSPAVSLKKAQRVSAEVREAANEYAEAVYKKTAQPSPFAELTQPGLEATTLASLEAERDALAKKKTSKK
ncbi:hypothetical protein [Glaciihabitans sp. dw_435]|uniref:hypothetical protein n=1 Tax=Glaciihabitans sp. dw_435 TaxID=2720081 RepID=UPI001BD244B9|nr:hypothetical protein [Glaciihabitans sp. dw_435]